ncbi:uncharacterized [Tachysurus ichikawai]
MQTNNMMSRQSTSLCPSPFKSFLSSIPSLSMSLLCLRAVGGLVDGLRLLAVIARASITPTTLSAPPGLPIIPCMLTRGQLCS